MKFSLLIAINCFKISLRESIFCDLGSSCNISKLGGSHYTVAQEDVVHEYLSSRYIHKRICSTERQTQFLPGIMPCTKAEITQAEIGVW